MTAVKTDDLNIPMSPLTDDETLALTRTIRQRLITAELVDGIPDDSRSRRRLMDLLEQVDTSTLTAKKLVSDDNNADADRQAAMLVHRIRNNLGDVDTNIMEGEVMQDTDVSRLPTVTILEGEMDVTVSTKTYSEFMAEQEDS